MYQNKTWRGSLLLGSLAAFATVGPQALAIHNGPIEYKPNAVVYIDLPGGRCTGTLVTPNWVLTANHCTTGRTVPCYPDVGGLEDFDVPEEAILNPEGHFSVALPPAVPDPEDPTDLTTMADPGAPGSVWVDVDRIVNLASDLEPVDVCDPEIAIRDVALLHLKRPLRYDQAVPINPPILDGNTCPESFNGRILGYGPNGWDGSGDDDSLLRAQDHNWVSDYMDADNAYLQRDWKLAASGTPDLEWLGFTPFTVPLYLSQAGYAVTSLLDYGGMQGGDSGGPLLYHPDGEYEEGDPETALCGVASKTWLEQNFIDDGICLTLPPHLNPFCFVTQLFNHYVATDTHEVKAFLAANILVGNHFECQSGVDDDGDGMDDECDNCVGVSNPSQKDSDNDGNGNACDICPGFDDYIDGDYDGVPYGCDKCPKDGNLDDVDGFVDTSNGDWDGDGVCNSFDICVYAKDPGQLNSNSLAETVRGTWVEGDACEPVPATRADVLDWDELNHPLAFAGARWRRADRFNVITLRSNAIGTVDPGLSLPVYDVPTDFRFCGDSEGIDCLAPENVHDQHLEPGLTAATETADMPWHRITLEGMSAPGEQRIYDHQGVVAATERWLYVDDAARFAADGLMVVPPPTDTDVSPAEGLQGNLWIHSNTGVGSTLNIGTGYHAKGLANHYFYLDPEWVDFQSPWAPIILQEPAFFELFYPKGDPAPWRDLGDQILIKGGRDLMVQTETGFGLLSATGAAQDLADVLSRESLAMMGGTQVMAGSMDAPFKDEPMALFLSADGARLAGALYLTGEKLITSADREAPGLPLLNAEMPADRDVSLLYSARLRSVYRIGERSGEIYRGDLALGSFAQIASGLGQLRAAAASAGPGELYLVETTERETRILAMAAYTGAVREIARIPAALPATTRVFLGLAADGAVMLSISRAEGQGFDVLRFDAETGAPPVLVEAGDGSLLYAPLFDAEGVVLGAVGRDERLKVSRSALTEDLLPLRSWEDVAGLF